MYTLIGLKGVFSIFESVFILYSRVFLFYAIYSRAEDGGVYLNRCVWPIEWHVLVQERVSPGVSPHRLMSIE